MNLRRTTKKQTEEDRILEQLCVDITNGLKEFRASPSEEDFAKARPGRTWANLEKEKESLEEDDL